MKLTYTIDDSAEHPGMKAVRMALEDDEPLLDITLTLPPDIVDSQFPAIAHTLKRAWYRKNGWPMPEDKDFKTLKEAQNGVG